MAMCDECLETDNLDCKPTPMQGHRPHRIDLDRDHYGPNRKWTECTHCREDKKKCSLKKKTDKPPCKRCKRLKIGCHFYDKLPSTRKTDIREESSARGKPKSKSKRPAVEEDSPEISDPESDMFSPEDLAYINAESSTDENDEQADADADSEEQELMEDAEGHVGYLTTIKTSYAHPMTFSIRPTIHNCEFCIEPMFGFVGHFEREVHAMQWSNGLGYTEFGNGHREESAATKMCYQCTFQRLQIMLCADHDIRSMKLDRRELNHDAAANDLLSAEGGSRFRHQQLQRWCSLCFSLARHQCYTTQESVMGMDDGDADLMEGCGLRLCDRCAQELDQKYQNRFNSMVNALDGKPRPKYEQSDDGEEIEEQGFVRADLGLLKEDGLLAKCCMEADAADATAE